MVQNQRNTFLQNQRNKYEIIWEIHFYRIGEIRMKISEKYIYQDLWNLHLCVCVFYWARSIMVCAVWIAGGRKVASCLTAVWRCGSSTSWVVSAPPSLLLSTHTAQPVNPLNLGTAGAKREKTGSTLQVRDLAEKSKKWVEFHGNIFVEIRTVNWKDCVEASWVMWQFCELPVAPPHPL